MLLVKRQCVQIVSNLPGGSSENAGSENVQLFISERKKKTFSFR
jgi:hypothetical protein